MPSPCFQLLSNYVILLTFSKYAEPRSIHSRLSKKLSFDLEIFENLVELSGNKNFFEGVTTK